MSGRENDSGVPVPDQASEPIVAFYLTQETGSPATFQGEHQVVTIKVPDSLGKLVEKPALRVTFSHNSSIEELVGLIGFGYDPRCHVLLPAGSVSSVHCRIIAQLNSGPQVWLVDDTSTQGTQVEDDETAHDELAKIIHGRRQASQGLRAIKFGPYAFQIRPPVISAEVQRRKEWFRLNKPVPVTSSMLHRQLGGRDYNCLRMEKVGEGGNGVVYKCMERNTGLIMAIKHEETRTKEHKAMVMKEITLMRNLRHVSCFHGWMAFANSMKPFLVDILFDESDNKPLPTIFTAMPLYLGHLRSILPLPNVPTTERIMIQIAEGVHFMHSKLILHRDLKPDNVLVVSPGNIKIADYGWATSLEDTNSLYGACGTTAYCAPEALYKPKEIHTPAIDVYSLGAMFYSMLDLVKVDRGWVIRVFHGEKQWFNTTFENASDNSLNLFAGLIQSMLNPNPENRCSLDECREVVKAQKYNWTKRAALMPLAAPTHFVDNHTGTQKPTIATRLQQTPFGKARAAARVPQVTPFDRIKMPENRLNQLKAPVKHDYKHWQPVAQKQEPALPTPQAMPVQKPCEPAPIQGVDFNAGLPSYEEATSQNPFARLTDSRKMARKTSKKTTKKHISQAIRRSREQAVKIHRAQAAGDRKPGEQLGRQAVRKNRLADVKKSAYGVLKGYRDTAKGSWFLYRALFGLACEGLLVGGERIYNLFNDTPGARKALENAVPSINANKQLMSSMQRHSFKAALSNGRSASKRLRDCADQEMVHCQLMPPRKWGLRRL